MNINVATVQHICSSPHIMTRSPNSYIKNGEVISDTVVHVIIIQ